MTVRKASMMLAASFILTGNATGFATEIVGTSAPIGLGSVKSYAVIRIDGTPQEIGIVFSGGALSDLPQQRNKTSRCFDLNNNGIINDAGECEGDYENNLPFPTEVADRFDIPFDFAMINWNPEGHPPEPWLRGHFDIHFYQIPELAVEEMRLGSCGIFMNCDDFQRAIKPVPEKYVHPEYASVEAAVGRMGNHLIDTMTPEFGTPPRPFTHTWIFGAYDGSVIFHEIMAAHSFMVLGPDTCAPIKQPEAWEFPGYYPTSYCFDHAPDGTLKVFMEGFVLRPAG